MSIKIGCLSDTHGFYDQRLDDFLGWCDEIWHAGDIGSIQVAGKLEAIAPLRAVHGNIDGQEIRNIYPAHQRFICGGIDVWITHIGGYPGKYDPAVRGLINSSPPGLFIAGHSHILKVMRDKKRGLLHINPGAAGRIGLHTVQTAIRFVISEGVVTSLEVIELPRNRD